MVDAEDENKESGSEDENSDGEQKGPPEESEKHRLKKFLQEVENMSENLIGLDEAHFENTCSASVKASSAQRVNGRMHIVSECT